MIIIIIIITRMYIGTRKGGTPIQSVQFTIKIKTYFSSQGNVNRENEERRKEEKNLKTSKMENNSIINFWFTGIMTTSSFIFSVSS